MKYDFKTAVDRFGKDSISANIVPWSVKPDEGFSTIPMLAADDSFIQLFAGKYICKHRSSHCYNYYNKYDYVFLSNK